MPKLKRFLAASRSQLATNRSISWVNGVTLLLLLALSIYAKVWGKGRGIELLFDDPFSPQKPYAGFLTGISEILWCLTAAICAFSFSLLKSIYRRPDRFIFCSALGIGILLVDDLFRLTLILNSLAGVPKILMYLIYATGAIAYSCCFRRRILSSPYVLLLIASGLFIFSSLVDITPLSGYGAPAMLEDGTKLLGLLNIALYFWSVCRQAVLRALSPLAA